MIPTTRLEIITEIALKLQAEYNTTSINILLGGYDIQTEDVFVVNSKKTYVIDLLKSQPNEVITKIANDLDIDVPTPRNNIDMTVQTPQNLELQKIFISHSSLDSKMVEKVIDLLEIIGVPSNQIFCSSFEGYGVKLGSDFLEVIRNELDSNVLVLFILSSNFYSSAVSLCEMGATWVKTNNHIPILIPPFEYADIKGVIPTTHGMKINEKEKLNSLKDVVLEFMNLKQLNTSIWERKRDKVLKEIKKELESSIANTRIEKSSNTTEANLSDEYYDVQDKKIKELSKKEWPDDFEMQLDFIKRQNDALKKLKEQKPIDISEDDFKSIRKKGRQEWPNDFEMQLDYEQRQIESLRRLREV